MATRQAGSSACVDLSFLQRLYQYDGPYATVYLDAEPLISSRPVRWRSLREQLTDSGAAGKVVTTLDEAMAGPRSRDARVLVAAPAGLLLDQRLPSSPRAELVYWGLLPHLLPMLIDLHHRLPHVVVLADRAGADIRSYGPDHEEDATVRGRDHPQHEVQAVGWSHWRYQQRAENLWEHDAEQIAERVDRLATRHRARVVILAGDAQARMALCEHLPTRSRLKVTEVELTGRAAGIDEAVVDAAVDQILHETEVRAQYRIVERFTAERGLWRACEGLDDSLDALARSAAETLLIQVETPPTGLVWIGERPELASRNGEVLQAAAQRNPRQERADAALVRAAVATDTSLVSVEQDHLTLTNGVGALLRSP